MDQKTDRISELVQQLQNENFDAFTELYNLTHGDIEAVCRSILRNPEDAMDAAQDTYLTIYRSFAHEGIAEIKDSGKFLPWAKTIARHTCLNQFNKNKKQAERRVPIEAEGRPNPLETIEQADQDRDYSPEDRLDNEFIRQCLEHSLETLPEMRRLCLTLHESGLTTREISEKLAIPEGTVKSHIRYAKKALEKSVRDLEKREKISLHGLIWVPMGSTLVPFFTVEKAGSPGWISAEAKHPVTGPVSHAGWSVAKIVLTVVVAAGIIAGVVLIATHVRRNQNFSATNTVSSTAISSSTGYRPVNRPSAENSQASSQSRPNAAPRAASEPDRARTNTASTDAVSTTAPPTTAPTTTRRRLNGPVIPN